MAGIPAHILHHAGAVDCTCFDKTGTITEDGMDMWGVVSTIKGMSTMLVDAAKTLGWHPPEHDVTKLPNDSLMLLGMATCHELNIIGGEMRGDPLDEKMFSSTGWSMEVKGEESAQLHQLSVPYVRSPRTASNSVIQAAQQKVFQFSSDVQRMSVITRVMEEKEGGSFLDVEDELLRENPPGEQTSPSHQIQAVAGWISHKVNSFRVRFYIEKCCYSR